MFSDIDRGCFVLGWGWTLGIFAAETIMRWDGVASASEKYNSLLTRNSYYYSLT